MRSPSLAEKSMTNAIFPTEIKLSPAMKSSQLRNDNCGENKFMTIKCTSRQAT